MGQYLASQLHIARLREKNFVDVRGETVFATDAGHAALPDAVPLPVGEELQSHWRSRLPQGELAVFDVLLAAYPEGVDRETITEKTGYKRSTRDTYLARMNAKEIVEDAGPGMVRASETLFT